MAQRRKLVLTNDVRTTLERWRDKADKPYLRERAAAILKIAAGMSPHHVAMTGLLKPRKPDTVYGWLDRFEDTGSDGLIIRPGRGRKPAFSPALSDQLGR